MDQNQESDDLSNGSAAPVAEDYSRMSRALVAQHELIFVVRVNDALVGQREGDMVNIIGAAETRPGGRRQVDSPAP